MKKKEFLIVDVDDEDSVKLKLYVVVYSSKKLTEKQKLPIKQQ